MPKMSGYANKSVFMLKIKGGIQKDVAFCIPPLILSIKTLLFVYPDIFGICVIKQKCLVFSNTDFFF